VHMVDNNDSISICNMPYRRHDSMDSTWNLLNMKQSVDHSAAMFLWRKGGSLVHFAGVCTANNKPVKPATM
jgi:hypothetical protein